MKSSSLSGRKSSGTLARVMARAVVWDNHGCMPLRADDDTFLPQLRRYRDAGVDVVSLNVGFDAVPWENTLRMLAHFRRWVQQHDAEYVLVQSVADVRRAKRERKLAVTFDVEGGAALTGQLSMVSLYYDLGVRWMLIAYNRNNALGGGCQDEDTGLTAFGWQVLDEMARVGMVTCCTHTGLRTTMDVMAYSRNPVIFSHSNPTGVWQHKRNIPDEAIKACAKTGGVVGINGIGIFLGKNDARSETVVRHVDYVVQLVGAAHAGLGLDYVFDQQEVDDYVAKNPDIFPPEEGYAAGLKMMPPEQLPEVAEGLIKLGYSEHDVRGILGDNFLRVAKQVWK
ncbi:MAG: membrane dipeptidase [Gemmatimonadetes bacterium]|nr:membrane dipeptidase [Gemmatimonadota bacterium]